MAEKVEEHLTVDAYVGRGEGHEREVSRQQHLDQQTGPKMKRCERNSESPLPGSILDASYAVLGGCQHTADAASVILRTNHKTTKKAEIPNVTRLGLAA